VEGHTGQLTHQVTQLFLLPGRETQYS
jgi:hypothetical protein